MELYKMTFDPEFWKRSFCTKSGNVLGGMIPYTMLTAVVEREFDKMIKSIVDYESSSEDGLDDPTISKIEEDGVNIIRECMTNATIYCINNHCGYNIPNSIFVSIFKNLFDDDAKSSRNLLVEERLTPIPQWMHDFSNKYDWDDPFMVLIYRLHHALLLAEEGSEKIIERRICEEDKRIWFDRLDFGQHFVNCGHIHNCFGVVGFFYSHIAVNKEECGQLFFNAFVVAVFKSGPGSFGAFFLQFCHVFANQ